MTNITVTKEQVQENMQDVIVRTLQDFDKPCTYVTVRMKNGFTLRESTTCVDPANYDEEIGKQICLKKIEDKVWFLLGYALQDEIAKGKEKQNDFTDEQLAFIRDEFACIMEKTDNANDELDIINVCQRLLDCPEYESYEQFKSNTSNSWVEIRAKHLLAVLGHRRRNGREEEES